MKSKRISAVVTVIVMIIALTAPAMAAPVDESPVISVNLDGWNIDFNEFAPELSDSGRTFLPFRQVFEALGCTVGYDEELKTATAVRGDTTVIMQPGSREAVIIKNGAETKINMDVASYVKSDGSGGGYTYVPVRFAAQALGCNVGWDQASRTVIIVDIEKIFDEILAGESFETLGKYMAYYQKYNSGNWAFDGTATVGMSSMGVKIIDADISLNGLLSGMKMQFDMSMDMDMSGLAALDDTMPEEMMKMSFDIDVRGDVERGVLFMNCDLLNEMIEIPAGTWISIDMGAMFAELGLDWSEFAAMSNNPDLMQIYKTVYSSIPLDSLPGDAYAAVREPLAEFAALLGDGAFEKTSSGYTATINVSGLNITLTFTTDAADEVTGYSLKIDGNISAADMSGSAGGFDDMFGMFGFAGVSVSISASEANDKQTMSVSIDAGSLFSLSMDMDCTYKASNSAPQTAPPAGAAAFDLFEMMM
ncbi:MAG: copper amine oxidase N-terminal domain-containing protein [Oscillospiraceae bacterium]|nr:copper amine oxidase N-terminal domain-containing protein [Oscillospiraceae bacterium]